MMRAAAARATAVRRSRGLHAAILLVAAVSACDNPLSTTTAEPLRGGHFTLAAHGGRAVPDTLYEMHTRDGGRSGCYNVLTEGYLELEPDFGIFDLHYVHRSSCGGNILSRPFSAGVYEMRADSILFTVPALAERSLDFGFLGRMTSDAVTVAGYASETLEFRGSPVEATTIPPSREGPKPYGKALKIVRYGDRPLPIDLGPSPSGCTAQLAHGWLILEPDFRIFELEIHMHDSCTDALLSPGRVVGVYEQRGDELTLVAPSVGPGGSDVRYDIRIEQGLLHLAGAVSEEIVLQPTGEIITW